MAGDLGGMLGLQGTQPHMLAEVVDDDQDVAVLAVRLSSQVGEVNLKGRMSVLNTGMAGGNYRLAERHVVWWANSRSRAGFHTVSM